MKNRIPERFLKFKEIRVVLCHWLSSQTLFKKGVMNIIETNTFRLTLLNDFLMIQ